MNDNCQKALFSPCDEDNRGNSTDMKQRWKRHAACFDRASFVVDKWNVVIGCHSNPPLVLSFLTCERLPVASILFFAPRSDTWELFHVGIAIYAAVTRKCVHILLVHAFKGELHIRIARAQINESTQIRVSSSLSSFIDFPFANMMCVCLFVCCFVCARRQTATKDDMKGKTKEKSGFLVLSFSEKRNNRQVVGDDIS